MDGYMFTLSICAKSFSSSCSSLSSRLPSVRCSPFTLLFSTASSSLSFLPLPHLRLVFQLFPSSSFCLSAWPEASGFLTDRGPGERRRQRERRISKACLSSLLEFVFLSASCLAVSFFFSSPPRGSLPLPFSSLSCKVRQQQRGSRLGDFQRLLLVWVGWGGGEEEQEDSSSLPRKKR